MEHKQKVIIFLLVCAAILTLIIKPHNKVIYPMIDITLKVFNVIGGQTESSTLDGGHTTSTLLRGHNMILLKFPLQFV